MKRNLSLGSKKPPDLGQITPKLIEPFERALAEKEDLQNRIAKYASKQRPTIRELLILAFFRNCLSFLEPSLPNGYSPAAASIWSYWAQHPEECKGNKALGDAILGYLKCNCLAP